MQLPSSFLLSTWKLCLLLELVISSGGRCLPPTLHVTGRYIGGSRDFNYLSSDHTNAQAVMIQAVTSHHKPGRYLYPGKEPLRTSSPSQCGTTQHKFQVHVLATILPQLSFYYAIHTEAAKNMLRETSQDNILGVCSPHRAAFQTSTPRNASLPKPC